MTVRLVPHTTRRMLRNMLQIALMAALILGLFYAMAIGGINLFINSTRGKRLMNDGMLGYAVREFSADRISLGLDLSLTVTGFRLSRDFGFVNGIALSADRIVVRPRPAAMFGAGARELAVQADNVCTVDNTGQPGRIVARRLELTGQRISMHAPFEAQAAADIDARGRSVRVEVETVVDVPHRHVQIVNGTVDRDLVVRGDVDMQETTPRYALTVEGSSAVWHKVLALVPGGNKVRTSLDTAINYRISGTPGNVTVENNRKK